MGAQEKEARAHARDPQKESSEGIGDSLLSVLSGIGLMSTLKILLA
jgi:hypothetical protein